MLVGHSERLAGSGLAVPLVCVCVCVCVQVWFFVSLFSFVCLCSYMYIKKKMPSIVRQTIVSIATETSQILQCTHIMLLMDPYNYAFL